MTNIKPITRSTSGIIAATIIGSGDGGLPKQEAAVVEIIGGHMQPSLRALPRLKLFLFTISV